jgi:uncharacterized hydrophobic protein (TIGR00271 family)
MRLILLKHPDSERQAIGAAAAVIGATSMGTMKADEDGRAVSLLVLRNSQVEGLLRALAPIADLDVLIVPHEVLHLRSGAAAEQEGIQSGMRSPTEIYLNALSAIGGRTSFLAYAALAGVLGWAGLYTNTVYLLVAAMLVAPYPNPALNTAIATARGHGRLLVRSVARYFLALAIGITAAVGLSAAFGVERAGDLAEGVAAISSAAFILPLVAGVVGGIHLSESEESSLVSAAAAGVLVAAALSPPVGIFGMALWTGETALAVRSGFLLVLQVVGINLTAAATFRLRGLGLAGPWYRGGKRVTAAIGAGATVVAMAALLGWQLSSPDMRRGSAAREALTVARTTLERTEAGWVAGELTIHGVGADAVTLTTIRARWNGDPARRQPVRDSLASRIAAALAQEGYPTPLVDLTLLQ